MFNIFAKRFRFGTPHLLDFQVAAWWLARLYACFRKVAPLALPVEVFALVHCNHTPTVPLHPPPPERALAHLVSSSQGMAGLAWHGMVWYGLVREPGAFIMKCGDTCRDNIPKLILGLSVKLLQFPLQGSGKALDARARSPRRVKPRHGWLGLAWYGMVWLGARARCFHNEVR